VRLENTSIHLTLWKVSALYIITRYKMTFTYVLRWYDDYELYIHNIQGGPN